MQDDNDLVGVVVPMFNSERTISATLKSISGQTHRRLDIVVVDDGSTDGSAAVAASWQARDPRVRLVRQANAGVAAARNKGAASTDAKLLAFVDADDLWAPTKIEYQLKALQADGPSVGLVYCWYASIDGQDNVCTFGPQPLDEGWVLQRLCAHNLIGNGSTLLVRRSAFELAGGYDTTLRERGAQGAEDFLICLRIAEHAEFRVVPRYLVGYRQVPGSMSTNSMTMFRSTEIALSEYRRRFPDFADDIDAHLQDFRIWFAWGALRAGQWRDAAALIGQCTATRPLVAPLRFTGMVLDVLRGRLFRRLHLIRQPMPLYTGTIW